MMSVLNVYTTLSIYMNTLFIHIQDGASALYVAAQNNCVKVAELLLERGANVDAPRDVRC